MKIRLIVLVLLLALGAALIGGIVLLKNKHSYPPTTAPIFELLGKPIKTVDAALTKVLPIDDLDEKELGDAIALRYQSYAEGNPKDQQYLQNLLKELSRNGQKGFQYRIFIMPTAMPNAYAMPGGVLFITQGMLDLIESEAELVSILGHEIGHVELSHCMDGARFELLSRKLGRRSSGEWADLVVALLLRHSFSKTQEGDADQYGFKILLREEYNPFASSSIMKRMDHFAGQSDLEKQRQASLLSEYFMTHPYSHMRAARLQSAALRANMDSYYIGLKNYQKRVPRYTSFYKSELIKKEISQ